MDWFKGKFTEETPIVEGENHGFRLRFSLKPIHWTVLHDVFTISHGHFRVGPPGFVGSGVAGTSSNAASRSQGIGAEGGCEEKDKKHVANIGT
jgi:hypothetical protein